MAINLNYYFLLFNFLLLNYQSSWASDVQADFSADKLDDAFEKAIKIVSQELLDEFRSAQGLGDDIVSRVGRSSIESPYDSTSPDHEFQRLVDVKFRFKVCKNPLHITSILYSGLFLDICISADAQREVTIAENSLSTNRSSPHVRITQVTSPVMSAAFVHDNKLHVLIADQHRSDGVTMNIFGPDFLSNIPNRLDFPLQPLALSTPYPNVMKLWHGADGTVNLAISTLPDPSRRRSTYLSETKLFQWESEYNIFDPVASVSSYKVSDICPFIYGGKDYIVIVNSAATPTHSGVDSSVYRINFGQKKSLTLVQTLRFQNAVDCETFTLPDASNRASKVAYLAIANHQKSNTQGKTYGSVIYKFTGEHFIASQVIPTVEATKIKSYESPTGAFALLVADKSGVKTYQYNGWKFLPTALIVNTGALSPGIVDIDVATIGPDSFIFVCNPRAPNAPNVVQLIFEKDEVLKKWRTNSLAWCQSAKSSNFDSQLDSLDDMLTKDVFFVDQKEPIELHGNLHLESPRVDVQGILSAPYVFNHEDIRPLHHSMTHELAHLEQQLIELEGRVERASHLLTKALRLDRADQLVTGQYTFENLDVSCGQSSPVPSQPCFIGAISAQNLNGADVSNLARQIIRIDREQVITHPNLTFNYIESVSDINVHGAGIVNGVNISNLINKSGRQVINSPVTIAGPITVSSIEATGLVNGVKFTNQTVLTRNGDQVISSAVEFTTPIKTRNLDVNFVNSQNFGEFIKNVVTVDGDYVISGRKTFKQIDVEGRMNINSSISGVDIAALHDNMMWTDGEQTISSDVHLDQLTVGGNLDVGNEINGVRLDKRDIVLNRRSEPVIITAGKTFTSPVRVDHLHVKGTINGLGAVRSERGDAVATDWPEQLDILVKSKAQSIPVRKIIAGDVHLDGHSTVQGTVNDVDLSDLARAVLKYDDTNSFSGTWSLVGNVEFLAGVTVKGTVNGVNVSHLYDRSLKLDAYRPPSFADKFVFDNAVVTGLLTCRDVNGVQLERDLMTKDTDQIITGVKSFKNGLHIANDFEITGTFNGLPLHFLNDSLLSESYQMVRGHKVIDGDLIVNNLYTKTLNGINLASELILLNSSQEQVISGRKSVKNVKVSHGLDVNELNIANKINGVDVNDLLNGTMLYNAHQQVSGMKKLKEIILPKDSTLQVTSLSGYPFSELLADAVYVDIPANITGNITFTGAGSSFKSIQFFKSFDGVSDRTFRNNWLLQGVDQEIDGDLILTDKPRSGVRRNQPTRKAIEIKGNLDIAGRLNGHQVHQLNSSIVKVNEPAIVRGSVTFTGTVNINNGVNLSGKIQGIKLSQDAVTRSQNNVTVYGSKTFKSHVTVTDTLNVNGYVDGILVDSLCSNAVRSNGRQHLRYPLTVLGNVTASSLTSGGRVAGVDLRRYIQLCLHKDNPHRQVVNGKKHFKNLWITGPVTAATFGGIDPKQLETDYMSLTQDQLISSEIYFTKGATFESPVQVDGNFVTRNGLVSMNGHVYNFSNIRESTLRLNGDQVINVPFVFKEHVNFTKNLVIEKPMVNRVPFSWLELRSRMKREINANVAFDQVDANDLIMADGKTVQGIDVSRLARSIVGANSGSNNIAGDKYFTTVTVDDLIVKGKVNGFKIDKESILLSTPGVNQIINGRAIFNQVKVNSQLVSSSINGVQLDRWAKRLVLNGSTENSTIFAPKRMSGPVNADETWTMKLIDGLDVKELNDAVFNQELEREAAALDGKLNFHENKLQRISRFLDHQEQCVDHYTFTREIFGRQVTVISTVNDQQLIATATAMSDNACARLQINHLTSKSEQIYENIFNPNLVALVKAESNNSYFSAIVSVSGSPVDVNSAVKCLATNAASAAGKYVAQILYTNGVKTYITLNGRAHNLAIVKNTPSEVCLLVAGHPASDVICITKSKANVYPTMLTSRQFATAYLTEWRMTIVATLSSSEVKIHKWNTGTRSAVENVQTIKLMTPERDVHSVIHLTGAYADPKYLVIAEAKSAKVRDSRPLVRFFKRQSSSTLVNYPFTEIQQIHEDTNVLAIASLSSPSHDMLFMLNSDFVVKVYRLQGASGWIVFDTLSLQSFATHSVLSVGWDGMGKSGHWLAVTSHTKCAIVETAIASRPSH